jgi:hypothetical protein
VGGLLAKTYFLTRRFESQAQTVIPPALTWPLCDWRGTKSRVPNARETERLLGVSEILLERYGRRATLPMSIEHSAYRPAVKDLMVLVDDPFVDKPQMAFRPE